MSRPSQIVIIVALVISATRAVAGPFPDRVADYFIGSGGGFGLDFFPDNVLGPPAGGEDSEHPQDSPMHLFSLGNGGWITLEYVDSVIVDGPGPDFIVFENVFVPQSNPDMRFCETAVVAVSQDGDAFTTFTFRFHPRPDNRVGYADQYEGLAGVNPTLSNPANGIDPTDPARAGGDAFDLADVGLLWVRFIRIRDTGIPGTATQTLDPSGNAVDDPGNAGAFLDPATLKVGFDLDAVAAVHRGPRPDAPTAATSAWLLVP